ncbi:hypothetical protein ABGF48_03410 [Helcococcus bovis]|uniref:hypothetical protein n=1 Tax=Helcococcus bovis TaxID=3153252 RepID=UPI0038B9F1EC
MNIKFDNSGFKKALKKLEQKANSISGSYDLDELLDSSFMTKYTNLESIDEFFQLINVTSIEEYKALSEGQLDNAVREISSFSSYQEMLNTAAQELIIKNW